MTSSHSAKYDRASQAMRSRTDWEPGAICFARRIPSRTPITAVVLWRDALRMPRGRSRGGARPTDLSC
ncbi:hypothetical protein CCAX7_57470 [Capsulimonas corticalis]|uniref:Uncharacterized protein n=1 Tax=Capsulimonas corticalis TaxID=2219043 RepID=A0A402D092_9BACT|nr:hypothetical protein CCAX7_57470 [Capsulimonas corticalis]